MRNKITSFFVRRSSTKVKENIAPTPLFNEQTLDGFPETPLEADIQSVGSLPEKQNSLESISDASGADPLFKPEDISTSSSILSLKNKNNSQSDIEVPALNQSISQHSIESSGEELFENLLLTDEQVATVLNITLAGEQKIDESPFQAEPHTSHESSSVGPPVAPVLLTEQILSSATVPVVNIQQSILKENNAQPFNYEGVVDWIVKHKAFLVASFTGDLNKWVEEKVKIQDPLFLSLKSALDFFNVEFSKCMNDKNTVDVRKVTATATPRHTQFPSAQACFIDAVNGLTGYIEDDNYEIGERNSAQILPNIDNSLLREFLSRNKLVASCLQTKLITLNEIAQLWAKDKPIALDEVPEKPTVRTAFNYNRKKLTNEDIESKVISLPSNRLIGTAVWNGECFLDSITQYLNASLEASRGAAVSAQDKEISLSNYSYSVKYLRLLCYQYAHSEPHDWIRALISRGERIGINYEVYFANIDSTAEEFEDYTQKKRLPHTAVWGVPEIEGRILCELFNIQLHIIELYDDGNEGYNIDESMVTKDGMYIIQKFKPEDYDKCNNIIHLVNYKNHTVPMWCPSAPNNGLIKINPEMLRVNVLWNEPEESTSHRSKKSKPSSPIILPDNKQDNKLVAGQAGGSFSSLFKEVQIQNSEINNHSVAPSIGDDKARAALAAGSMNSLLSRVRTRTEKLSNPGNPDRLDRLGVPANPASVTPQNGEDSPNASPKRGTKRSAVVIY